jgi:hypothetical protein
MTDGNRPDKERQHRPSSLGAMLSLSLISDTLSGMNLDQGEHEIIRDVVGVQFP